MKVFGLACAFITLPLNADPESPSIVRVADFGAIPNDGLGDTIALRAALASVDGVADVVVEFEAGVYNLKEASILDRNGHMAMLHVWGVDNWTLRGAADAEGNPATTLEMNLTLENEITGASHLDIRNSTGVAVENFVLDQNPRFATAAEVIGVNSGTNTVTIDVFEGMPHFEGMASFSANNWDLATRLLIPGPPVTIGVAAGSFANWTKVAGHDRRYEIQDANISQIVAVGEGLSFHFNVVAGEARCIDAYGNEDILFENLYFYNVIGMVMGAGDSRNMTFRKFHVKPEGASLAVGPRDGVHITRSTGQLLMEDVMVKGVRWDPLVSYMHFVPITERNGTDRIRLDGSNPYHNRVLTAATAGSEIHFWSGSEPTAGTVSSRLGDTIIFTADLDAAVQAGTTLTPGHWLWENGIIRNSLIESNYGTALVYQSDNLLVENTIFRNNAYSNIGLGPSSSGAGVFTRNIVIRDNLFESSSWQPKYTTPPASHQGTISLFHNHSEFGDEPYHRNILIENNLFRNINGSNSPSAIHVKNAGDVLIKNNRYENTDLTVIVDGDSTEAVVIDEIQVPRTTGSSFAIDSLPAYLDDAVMVTFPRGANAPVPAFSFDSTIALSVYLAVHDRGTPTIPPEWILQPGRVVWRTSNTNVLGDKVYRRDFPAGTIDIPGHDGFSGPFFGVPHILFLFPGEEGMVPTDGFPASPVPTFHELELDLVWTGDGASPLSWAAEVGFENGAALSVFEGFLINRKDLDYPFRLENLSFDGAQHLMLEWPSDGLPHGEPTMLASENLDLPLAEWPPLGGSLLFENGFTRWQSSAPMISDRLFFRMEINGPD